VAVGSLVSVIVGVEVALMTTVVSEGVASARKDAPTDCVVGKKRLLFSIANTEKASPIPAMVARPNQAHFQLDFFRFGFDAGVFFT